jgi:hypothetical protein
MHSGLRSAVRWFAAGILVLLGVAGSLLPIVPGFVFFGLAIVLLAGESHFLRKWLRWVRLRYPKGLRWMRIPRGPTPAGEARRRDETTPR